MAEEPTALGAFFIAGWAEAPERVEESGCPEAILVYA
jgi:hypothetical protein